MRARRTAHLSSVKLSDQVTRALARRIANGEFAGEVPPPTESEICAEFGVSKTTAREVIRSLAERGFVEVRQGRRMQVRDATEWNQLDPLMIELIDDADLRRRLARSARDYAAGESWDAVMTAIRGRYLDVVGRVSPTGVAPALAS